MMNACKIVLIGIGGYGNQYVHELLNKLEGAPFQICGAVDPNPPVDGNLARLQGLGVPIYPSIETFYAGNHSDLAVISSPIQFHCNQACYAMQQGSNVLCEKPMSATVQDALLMCKTSREMCRFLAIGYQWSFSRAVLSLKADILSGLLGRPLRLRTLVLWPRDRAYYSRGWAGKMADSLGRPVRDSIANNAAAHYLHNMLFLLGPAMDQSLMPSAITAELYRANTIESFDTCALRIQTESNTEILFYASHAVEEFSGPHFVYEFENGVVVYSEQPGVDVPFTIRFKDGREKHYGGLKEDYFQKLWHCVRAVHTGEPIPCTGVTAFPHTLCIEGAHASMPEITSFPSRLVQYNPVSNVTYVQELGQMLTESFEGGLLPSEAGFAWARAGKQKDLGDWSVLLEQELQAEKNN